MADEAAALERLQTSAVDGRTENGRYRQNQLQALHATLRTAADRICAALQAHAHHTAAEAEAEYYLAMDAVRHFYDTLDFAADLRAEYQVVHGKDHAERRVGVGLVVVRPASHTRFYSVVAPLAAAIAAGNCVVLELSATVAEVDALLRDLLVQALDVNTFCIARSRPDDSLPEGALLVDQTGTATATSSPRRLQSPNQTRCVAIVDRSADLDRAAQAITTARFSFSGTSPYAPDLVLVNEFAKKEFFEACSRYATLLFAGQQGGVGAGGSRSTDSLSTRNAVEEAERKGQVSSFGSNDFKLVDVLDKTTPVMQSKITGRYLVIATCSSLTDAIYNHGFESPLLAGYFFAEPGSAKYLAQFLPCHLALLNQIPTHLLVGPAAPLTNLTTTTADDLRYRYTRAMFSLPRPQLVEPPPTALGAVDELLLPSDATTDKRRRRGGKKATAASMLRQVAVKPLPPTGQPSNDGVGFFESGLLVGAGMYLTVVLPAVGVAAYFLGRRGLEYAVRLREG